MEPSHTIFSMPELKESQTHTLLINPQLVAANWKLDDRSLVRFKIPVDGYDAESWNGVTDYCLYDYAGNVLAVNMALNNTFIRKKLYPTDAWRRYGVRGN